MWLDETLILHAAAWSLPGDLRRLAETEKTCRKLDRKLFRALIGGTGVDKMPAISNQWREALVEQTNAYQKLLDVADLLGLDA